MPPTALLLLRRLGLVACRSLPPHQEARCCRRVDPAVAAMFREPVDLWVSLSASCARPAGASVGLHWRCLQRRVVVMVIAMAMAVMSVVVAAAATMVRASALRVFCARPAGASVWRYLQRRVVVVVVVAVIVVVAVVMLVGFWFSSSGLCARPTGASVWLHWLWGVVIVGVVVVLAAAAAAIAAAAAAV